MSDKLYKFGKFSFQKRWWIIAFWAFALICTGTAMSIYQQPPSSSFNIPGTESQQALDKLESSMPEAAGGSGRIVFAAPDGKKITDYSKEIDEALANVNQLEDVEVALSPLVTKTVTEDGKIAFSPVQLTVSSTEVDEDLAEEVSAAVEPTRKAGLQTEVGGDIAQGGPSEIVGIGEVVGIVIAAITLFITLGTLIAAGLPLLVAMVGVAIGVTTIFSLGTLVEINTVTPVLAIMLGLAVGIDYALFIITRYRKYLMDDIEPKYAIARAIATAGNAVVFAALTVVIALSALTVIGIPFMSSMGLAAAGTVAISAAVAISLIPAMLSFIGLKALSKKQRKLLAQHKNEDTPAKIKKTIGYRWGSFITRKPLIPILLSVVVLVAIALPTTSLRLGFPSEADMAKDTSPRKAYDLLTEGFGPGFNGPLLLVADLPNSQSKDQSNEALVEISEHVSQTEGISSVVPAGLSEDNKVAILQATPTTGPTDAKTKELVSNLREKSSEIAGEGNSLAVTGSTAMAIDIDDKLAAALPKYLIVVVGLSLLILVAVFRSFLVPIKATLGFLLTITATLGALVMFFQWGWFGIFDPTPIVSFLPIIVTGILFGLAMDYEFFLVSGMHEAYLENKKGKARQAVVDGFAQGSKVVAAAAIIMISVFAGFILSHDQMIQMIGFALAFGILVDAFIVRMTIVPAVMSLFGHAAWWLPNWLCKILPNISIEGDEIVEKSSKAKKPDTKKKK